jgi:hypothetical protein
MKNFLITVGVALGACALAFGVFFALNNDPALRRAAREGDAMVWLRAEFKLDDAQFAAIKKLHDDYAVVCGEHCAAIMDARERKAPAAEVARLEKVCVEAMTGHFQRVAALMPTGQGERYLAVVLPRVADYGHSGAPNVRAGHSGHVKP